MRLKRDLGYGCHLAGGMMLAVVFLVGLASDYLDPRTEAVGLMFFVGVPLFSAFLVFAAAALLLTLFNLSRWPLVVLSSLLSGFLVSGVLEFEIPRNVTLVSYVLLSLFFSIRWFASERGRLSRSGYEQ